jgi:phosphonate transport system permease protein
MQCLHACASRSDDVLPASKTHEADRAPFKGAACLLLNALHSIPDLVWAALLLIAAGLAPFAGTLALGLHTAGVLGRLFAQSIENAPPTAAFALRTRGVSEGRIFCYATLPQIIPQLMSYTLYRWENNIRAAAVLGVVGGGGLGQMLAFHMGLFQMSKSSTLLLAMLVLVALVDTLSDAALSKKGRGYMCFECVGREVHERPRLALG